MRVLDSVLFWLFMLVLMSAFISLAKNIFSERKGENENMKKRKKGISQKEKLAMISDPFAGECSGLGGDVSLERLEALELPPEDKRKKRKEKKKKK